MDPTLGGSVPDLKEQVRDISRGVIDLIKARTDDVRETSEQNRINLRRVEREVKALQSLYEQATLREAALQEAAPRKSQPVVAAVPLRGRRLRRALLAFADLVDALEDVHA